LASSFSRNERLSKFVEPTDASTPSTTSTLQWNIVGWYSAIRTPASSSAPQRAREARRTIAESISFPGVMICTSTPRRAASDSALIAIASGTKYELESWMLR